MASNYTANYGLSQWEPGDAFIRKEFNENHRRLDAAIRGAEDQTALVGYNVYNLMLQSSYEGKTTGYQKALVFDGFLDGRMIQSLSPGLFQIDGTVGLCRAAQGNINMGYSDQATAQSGGRTAGPYTSAGYGTLHGLKVKTQAQSGQADLNPQCPCRVYLNGIQVWSGIKNLWFRAEAQELEVSFGAVRLKPGDTFSVWLQSSNGAGLFFGPAGGVGDLGGTLLITPAAGTRGEVVTLALDLPERKRLRAWVRFRGGSVALAAAGPGGQAAAMTSQGDRQTVEPQGAECTEREFLLERPPETGALTFTLSLELGEDEKMEVFDYGIVFL